MKLFSMFESSSTLSTTVATEAPPRSVAGIDEDRERELDALVSSSSTTAVRPRLFFMLGSSKSKTEKSGVREVLEGTGAGGCSA